MTKFESQSLDDFELLFLINNFFIVELDYRNRTKNVTLSEEELIWLTFVIEKWIKEIKSTKFLNYLVNTSVDNLFHEYTIAKQWLQKKKKRKRQQKKIQITLQQQLRSSKSYESLFILKKQQSILKKINTVVNITTIEFMTSKSVKWSDFVTSSQKSLFDISIVYESSSILKKISCNLFEINIDIMNSIDIESFDDILASDCRKWFVLITTLSEISVVNKFSFVSLQKFSQMQEKRSISSSRTSTSSSAHISKSWLTQNWRARSSFKVNIVDQSSSVLKQMSCNLSEINATIVNINDIESMNEILASESVKWSASITSLQTSLLEVSLVDEFSSVLKQIRFEISEINTTIVNIDIESSDEILVFESRNWIVASAQSEKIFDFTITSHAISKSSFASHIEKNIETEKALNQACVKSIVDVKTLNQKIFALIDILDVFSKNSLASYFKNIEIFVAMNISSLEHLINENDVVTETFDSVTEISAHSRNSLIQQIENSKTLKKNSIYIYEIFALSIFDLNIDIDFDLYIINIETIKFDTKIQISCEIICELSVLFIFDLDIDIDFEIYTTNIETKSFDWICFCTSSINRRIFSISTYTTSISSISICTTVSNVTFDSIEIAKTVDTVKIEFCEREQFFCFIDTFISTSIEISNIEFYERKQSLSFCFVDSFVSAFINCVVSENIDFYEEKQSFCFSVDDIVDVICIVVVVVNIDALTLIADMIKKKKKKKKKNFAWMSFMSLLLLLFVHLFVEYMIKKMKHKKLSKVKIKKLQKSKHINSKSQIVVKIFIEFTYKIILISDIQQRLKSLR